MSFNLLSVLLFLWLSQIVYRNFLSPKWRRKKKKITLKLNDFKNFYIEEKEKLSLATQQTYDNFIKDFSTKLANKQTQLSYFDDLDKQINAFNNKHQINTSINYYRQGIRSFLITIIVILILRNFFFMPFVIPTGSMQPTLNGINYYHAGQQYGETVFSPAESPNQFYRGLEALYYGRTYVDSPILNPNSSIKSSSILEVATHLLGIPFLQTFITIKDGKNKFYFPGTVDTLKKAVYNSHTQQKGRIKGTVEIGDFLLVNRWSYYFNSPKRGDIVIFSTASLKHYDKKLLGAFYIKRLIAIGGDTVRIDKKNQTWIRADSTDRFIKLQEINPDLYKLFNHKGGYFGHNIAPPFTQNTLEKRYSQEDYQQVYIFNGRVFKKQSNNQIIDYWSKYKVKDSGDEIHLISNNEQLIFKKQTAQKYKLFVYQQKNGYKVTINNNHNDYYIPKGYYFTLGDNTRNSLDGRYWGVVPQKELVGKPFLIFWPFSSRWGRADTGKIYDYKTQ